MKHFLHILLLLPALLSAQVSDIKFHSEFERQAFSVIDTSSQPKDVLRMFFAADTNVVEADFDSVYNYLLSFNEAHKLHKGARHLFDETQNNFFAVYETNTKMAQLFDNNTFSCVTGSSLLAFFLEINGIDYAIEEMPYHVFITVKQKNRNYILESTDTEYGYLPDIKVNRRGYMPDTIDNSFIFKEIGDYSHLEDGQIVVKGQISLKELAGLNYYNTAINHINSQNFTSAVYQLQKAYHLYPSQRIREVTKYSILQVLKDSSIQKADKIEFYELLVKLTYTYSAQ